MDRGTRDRLAYRRAFSVALAFSVSALLLGIAPAQAADPGADEAVTRALCCCVPPRGEVTADQVFGRWAVTKDGVGAPFRAGDRLEFRADGSVDSHRGPCRFAVLRAEMTVTCADKAQSGELRFVDDTKLIWRHDGRETMFVAPTD